MYIVDTSSADILILNFNLKFFIFSCLIYSYRNVDTKLDFLVQIAEARKGPIHTEISVFL